MTTAPNLPPDDDPIDICWDVLARARGRATRDGAEHYSPTPSLRVWTLIWQLAELLPTCQRSTVTIAGKEYMRPVIPDSARAWVGALWVVSDLLSDATYAAAERLLRHSGLHEWQEDEEVRPWPGLVALRRDVGRGWGATFGLTNVITAPAKSNAWWAFAPETRVLVELGFDRYTSADFWALRV